MSFGQLPNIPLLLLERHAAVLLRNREDPFGPLIAGWLAAWIPDATMWLWAMPPAATFSTASHVIGSFHERLP